ncbi:Uncharacterised protein [Vibrio cholerae]|uniref:Uncharacterized protein n=1 Tax=Vibrio cholerae TaxID=666 RepID=A0A655PXE2_VIBCL|nr:Uncharacterised protein [Vibrio cholerae]CSB43321.1 Uncharacterised protein [Vibrio cholerae]CSB71744.1 Uncharacterised protein [Vibrio cholerae]CSD11455.1 Uncharacterised protein [Vibrio cholerae]CSD14553.1 Uncharacterised protein [Vibrio cholerae]
MLSSPGGAANTVHVRFSMHRQLKVDHNGKQLNMNAARE